MIDISIYTISTINTFIAIYYAQKFINNKSILGLSFLLIWVLHYVLGNFLTLLSGEGSYNSDAFNNYALGYLLALIMGLYFLLFYASLINKIFVNDKVISIYSKRANLPLLIFFSLGVMFCIIFVLQIGVSSYFSPELAFYRTSLSDYTRKSIGLYYYLASLIIPATLMLGSYSIQFPNRLNIFISFSALIITAIFFIPMGGRGRIYNVIIILIINFFISKGEFSLKKFINYKIMLLIILIFTTSYYWANVRENPFSQVSTEKNDILRSLGGDLTRLHFQAFILTTYPIEGIYWGPHYISSILGPFQKYIQVTSADLIRELSAQWYKATLGEYNMKSAISPSFIGELYLNFGILGLLSAPLLFYLIIKLLLILIDYNHPLSFAVILYFFQFNFFHGGLYALFDMIILTIPIFFSNRYLTIKFVNK